MLTGDALAVQLFVAALCPAFLVAALPLVGLSQRALIRWLLSLAGLAALLAALWGPIVGLFPVLGASLGTYLAGSWASLVLLMGVFLAVASGLLRRLERAPLPGHPQVVSEPVPTPTQAAFDSPCVYGAHAAAKSLSRFSAVSRGNFDRIRIFVEISRFRGGIGAPKSWTKPEPLLIEELRDVVRGQTVTVDLVSNFEKDGTQRWRWGQGGEPTDTRYYFVKDQSYRGRVLVAIEGDLKAVASFISFPDVAEGIPNLVGRQNFDFDRTH